MNEIKWIKMTTDVFDDQKIKIIKKLPSGDMIIVVWFELLTIAGKINNRGEIYMDIDIPYNNNMLASIMDRDEQAINLAISVLSKFKLITITDAETILITNWEKHQNVEGMEQSKLLKQLRNRSYYEKQKLLCCKNSVVFKTSENDLQDVLDIDKELDKDIEKKRFTKPVVEEIINYCKERNNNINPLAFYNYYESTNWMRGNNKIKDWKACIRTWEQKDKTYVKMSNKLDINQELEDLMR